MASQSMEERMASVECAMSRLATKADVKALEVRLTRLIYLVVMSILISAIGAIVSIVLSLARLF